MRKGARFCVTCGASMSEPLNHEKREHGRNSKKRNFFLTLLLCAGVGAGIFLCLMLNEPDATNVILEDSYTIEDGKIALGLLDVVYSNGKTEEIGDYTIYIDDAIFGVKNGKVNAGQLSEGEHTMKVVWRREENTYEYEKRLDIRRYSFENLEKALLEKYGEIPLLFAGGVMSNQIIKNSFEEKYNAIFAPPQFSADNSAGIAYLGYRKYNDVHTRV